LLGRVSACFFLLASLLVIDGVQALMRDDFHRIDLPLGGQVLISGGMPLQAKNHTDIVAVIEGIDGLSFTPLTDFKGFWLGAHMWRATLDASGATEPGQAVLTILDMVPAKSTTSDATTMVQNPNLIYTITVWPSAEAMQAAHLSLIRRLTGLSAFIWAGMSLACALGIGAWHMVLIQKAHRALAQEDIFFIYGRKDTAEGYAAIFSPAGRQDLQARQPILLLTPQGAELRRGVLGECTPLKCNALFSLDGVAPRHGCLLLYVPETKPSSGHEETIPPPA